jgi:phospholipid/cholesterol/gamma-HCH transport system permease protein
MLGAIERLGRSTTRFVATVGELALFGVRIVRCLFTPPLRVGALLEEVYKLGVLSLVIICASGVTVGMVLGLQGYNTLARFGATESLGAVVGLSLVRELGPVLTALLATGRAGSATTAEIGTMVATEQLDGLRMMSADPVHVVVFPRAAAMMLAMPLLSGLFIAAGILGGYLVGIGLLGGDGGTYLASVEGAIDFSGDVVASLVKATVFGAFVGLYATYRGFIAAPTSAGVGAATTSTVVVSSVCILLLDYVITALWGV